MTRSRQARNTRQRHSPDLEAIGLVLLALGVLLVGVLIPSLPNGELGRIVRAALAGRIGWASYALPAPLLILGGLFLLRRNPPWWPRLLAGFLVLVAGLWALAVALLPAISGSWGSELRGSLGAAWGVLALLPAAVVVTLGVDLLLGLSLTTSLRWLLSSVAGVLRAAFEWLLAARLRARSHAALQADAALLRRGLNELDKDLQALSALFPGSSELERWREEVKRSHHRLRSASEAAQKEARADLKAWQAAVNDFARDRAADMISHLEAERAMPPEPDSAGFEVWCQLAKQGLDEAFEESGRAAVALERLRKALILDITSLADRHRRLTRERDLDRRSLKAMTPRQLAQASRAHAQRLDDFRQLEVDADALSLDVDALDPWRSLLSRLSAALADFADHAELAEYSGALAKEVEVKGRAVLHQLGGWNAALDAVIGRALSEAEDEAARALESAAQAAVAREAEESLAADAELAAVREFAAAYPLRSAAGAQTPDPVEAALLDDAVVAVGAANAAGAGPASAVQARPRTLAGAATVERARPERPASSAVAPEPAKRRVAVDRTPPRRAPPVGQDRLGFPEVGAIPIQLPPPDLLDAPEVASLDRTLLAQEHRGRVKQIDDTLANFKLGGRVVASIRGPTVTRFEVEPAPGEKISRFSNLSDDLALAMAVGSVRIEAPIPGKSVIGLEVPNANRELVRFREAAESASFRKAKARLPIILGKSIDSEMIVADLAKMPHLLIAGSTGSGKSVAINTVVGSLLYRFLPTELRFLMIDPKMVELTPFDGIPHLLRPVVTNPSDASGVLLGAVAHMERRYKMMSKIGAKNLDQYNEKARNLDMPPMPFIAIVIDELADLMITSPKEVESAIMRLAQMARATGMHLILATQRPSVDILTSLIKVNVPARMAFAVSSSHDSRTILDGMGAERLIGMGDMLFYQPGLVKAIRLQGPFVSESEIGRVSAFLRRQYFDDDFVEAYGSDFDPPSANESEASGLIDWNDDKLRLAAELVVSEGQASVSRLQRRLSVGHARAGKLMDSLEALGVVGQHTGSKPRDVLVTFEELPNVFGK